MPLPHTTQTDAETTHAGEVQDLPSSQERASSIPPRSLERNANQGALEEAKTPDDKAATASQENDAQGDTVASVGEEDGFQLEESLSRRACSAKLKKGLNDTIDDIMM